MGFAPVNQRTCRAAGFALLCLALSAVAQTGEFRGVWVDAWGNGFLNAGQVTQLIADCRTYNFNAIVVQMRRRGDAFYNHTINDPKTTAIASGFDALQEIITQAHSGSPRIEVHCWVTTHVIWSSTSPPSQAGHVFNAHPECLMRNSAGTNFIAEGYYLDPGHPDATLWNYQMATNVVRRYDVDGFHWDYIRYPQQDSGYNPTAIARYNAEFGLAGQPSPASTQFSDWRRRQVTDFLRWVNADLLAYKPNLVISCAVFGSRTDAYNARFQDWAAWNAEGIIDLCMPMGYTSDNALFQSRCNDAFNHQGVRRVYQGQGAYLNAKENTVWQLDYIRSLPLSGSVLYSYRTPNSGAADIPGTLAYIRDNHQPTWVEVPAIPWKTAPTKALLRGTVTRQLDGQPVYNASLTISTSPARTQKTEPHGKFAFFELPPGTYTVTASGADLGSAATNVTLVAGTNRAVALVLPPDATPPAISTVTAINVTDTAATIAWTTDELSNSAVDYGPTVSYGSTVTNATMTLSHSITLANLAPNTTHHFRVRSRNSTGLLATSGDFTFRTHPAGQVNDVIIESRDATGSLTPNPPYADSGFSDSTLKSSAAGLSGTGSRYAIAGTPNFTIQPTLPVAGGAYDVHVTHGSAASVSDDIIVAIAQTGCRGLPATTAVLQQAGANTWEYVGRLKLDPGVTLPTLRFAYSSGTLDGNGNGRMYSDSIKFVNLPPPTITNQPAGRSVNRGANTTFSVGVTGAMPLSYQWRFNNAILTGATASSYTLFSAQTTNEGDYSVVITNVAGTVTSNPAFLIVNLPPTLGVQPQSQSAKVGTDVTFSVQADGTEPLNYQWRFNGTNLAGATESSFTRTQVQTNQAGTYSVLVTNVAGSMTSSNATLAVTLPQPGQFLRLDLLPDRRTRLVITGEAGDRYVLLTSSNLLHWDAASMNLNTSGIFEVVDPETNQPQRFYRTRN
jgi:uncharacterized lipoprotein YddW (UPF0748 family)